ncbi:hypothetical protein DVH24_005661 [Malus domestica]|uniref:Uncharacterized protein n=1 Tax=Malus domestica TaxID=3750 RepID=A0A498IIL7_MALDO|nr:hypothetical protein DVH24_005661 [Malus domestica]
MRGNLKELMELHYGVFVGCHLRLEACGVNLFSNPHKGKEVTLGFQFPVYAFKCLNRIYKAGLGLPEFRAFYMLRSISTSLKYFFESRHAG